MKTNEIYIKDLYLSSVLKGNSIPMLRVERDSSNICTFVFRNDNNIAQEIINDHLEGRCLINSLGLVEAITSLKTRIYSGV